MARKSAESLKVVPATRTSPLPIRPSPPSSLSESAKALWVQVTGSRAPEYFGPETLPMLESFCRSTAEYRRLMALVEQVDPMADPTAYGKLVRAADTFAARASQAATRLRLTHQSQTDSRGGGRASQSAGGASAEQILRRYRDAAG